MPNIVEKLQELVKANAQIQSSHIRQEGSKILLYHAKLLLRKVLEKASPATKLKDASLAKFQGTVERAQEYVRNISTQHRVQQFFAEDEIRTQLYGFHNQLSGSYQSLTDDAVPFDKQVKDADREDRKSIKEYMDGIGGDVTKIVVILNCGDPPKEVMSALRKRAGRKDVGPAAPASLLRDFIKWIERDWFWLTFTSDSRQEIKGPLTRVLPDIIPAIQDKLATDDKIALTSDDQNILQKVNKLFTVLDNSNNPALVQSFRSALADTNLRDKLREVEF